MSIKTKIEIMFLGVGLLAALALTLLAIVVPNWLVEQLKELLFWF